MPDGQIKYMKNKLFIAVMALLLGVSVNAFAVNPVRETRQSANLQKLGGEIVSLPDLKGKVVVLAIGASWLPLSKQQVLTTNKLVKKYAEKDVVIFWVTTDSSNAKSKNFASDEQVKAFATRTKLTATILRDSDGLATLKRFNVDQLPSYVILDKTGKSIGEPYAGVDAENENEIFVQISGAIDKIL